MKFQSTGNFGSGSSHAPLNFENLSWYDGTSFQYKTLFNHKLSEASEYETDKRNRVAITWYYIIFFKGTQLFEFNATCNYYISEEETPPTIEQAKNLSEDSHKYLRNAFEERRKEFQILPPISQPGSDTIEQTAVQLLEVLRDQPQP